MSEVLVKKESLTLERIALMAVVALLSWNVYTTNQLSIQQAVTQTQIGGLERALTLQAANQVSTADISALEAVTDQRIERLESWNTRLSDRIRILEKANGQGE